MNPATEIKRELTSSRTFYLYCLNSGKQLPMDMMERFFKIDSILKNSRYPVRKERFIDELEISLATWKRDLAYLRDRMHAPIEYFPESKGYQYTEGSDFQLPGLWMNEGEIHALLTMQQLLANLQPGMLDDHIKPLMERITDILEKSEFKAIDINKRIRILSMANRPINHTYFEMISSAVLARKRLKITYYSRGEDSETERVISPQRLVHYRENWYLDSWCHLRDGLRTFAMESIREAVALQDNAKSVAAIKLDTELGSGYGIFTGSKTQNAVLRFTPMAARWVAEETWHPSQNGKFDDDGYFILSFPFSDDRELIQDILKYGANVEVLKPVALVKRVKSALKDSLKQYAG